MGMDPPNPKLPIPKLATLYLPSTSYYAIDLQYTLNTYYLSTSLDDVGRCLHALHVIML